MGDDLGFESPSKVRKRTHDEARTISPMSLELLNALANRSTSSIGHPVFDKYGEEVDRFKGKFVVKSL